MGLLVATTIDQFGLEVDGAIGISYSFIHLSS